MGAAVSPATQNGTFRNENSRGSKTDRCKSTPSNAENGTPVPFSRRKMNSMPSLLDSVNSVASVCSVLNLFARFPSSLMGAIGSYRDLPGPKKCKNRLRIRVYSCPPVPIRSGFVVEESAFPSAFRVRSRLHLLAPTCTKLHQLAEKNSRRNHRPFCLGQRLMRPNTFGGESSES